MSRTQRLRRVAEFPVMKLDGQQEIFYVVGGKGTVTSAGETHELFDGVGILVPPGVEFSMKNIGDVDLTMYIINEIVPADFKPGTKVLVRDENLQPVRGPPATGSHRQEHLHAG